MWECVERGHSYPSLSAFPHGSRQCKNSMGDMHWDRTTCDPPPIPCCSFLPPWPPPPPLLTSIMFSMRILVSGMRISGRPAVSTSVHAASMLWCEKSSRSCLRATKKLPGGYSRNLASSARYRALRTRGSRVRLVASLRTSSVWNSASRYDNTPEGGEGGGTGGGDEEGRGIKGAAISPTLSPHLPAYLH